MFPSKAQSSDVDPSFTLSANVRLRAEAISGQPKVGFPEEEQQIAARTIISATYDSGPLRLNAELHDSRAWSDQLEGSISPNEVNTLEIVQANITKKFSEPFGKGSALSIQAGRMTTALGSRRLVAADDYRNATNGYTGLRADLRDAGGAQVTALYLLPLTRLPNDIDSVRRLRRKTDRESFNLQLFGVLLNHPDVIGNVSLELGYIGLRERDGKDLQTRDRQLDNFTFRIIREPRKGKPDFEAEVIHQSGSARASAAPMAALLPVSAWFLHADLGYSFSASPDFRVSIEYDRASGDRSGGKYSRFDTLFGMRGADFAQSGIYNAIGRANIQAIGARGELSDRNRWELYATYREMWLAERTDAFSTTGVRDPYGQSGRYAGRQVEVQARYWLIPKHLRAQLNLIWLGKGRFLQTAPNAPRTENTRYLATTFSVHF